MEIVTEFTVSAEAFALGHTLEELEDVRLEGEQMVSHSEEWVMPYFWVAGDAFEAFETAIAADSTVKEAQSINEYDSTRLYQLRWGDNVQQTITAVLNRDGVVLEATAHDELWQFTIRFSDREQLSGLQNYFADQRGTFTLQRLYEPTEPQAWQYSLTSEQREVLLLALDVGYFSVPRDTTTEELADLLEISPGAVSERLRRAFETLVENTLTYNQRPGHSR